MEGGSPDIVAALLTAAATMTVGEEDPQAAPVDSFTPLHLAAQQGHAALVPSLMQAGFRADDAAGDPPTITTPSCSGKFRSRLSAHAPDWSFSRGHQQDRSRDLQRCTARMQTLIKSVCQCVV